jgi:hypothetical protein
MIIGDGGRFPVTGETVEGELDDKRGLVGLGAAGNGEGMAESQVIRIIVTSHGAQN